MENPHWVCFSPFSLLYFSTVPMSFSAVYFTTFYVEKMRIVSLFLTYPSTSPIFSHSFQNYHLTRVLQLVPALFPAILFDVNNEGSHMQLSVSHSTNIASTLSSQRVIFYTIWFQLGRSRPMLAVVCDYR